MVISTMEESKSGCRRFQYGDGEGGMCILRCVDREISSVRN